MFAGAGLEVSDFNEPATRMSAAGHASRRVPPACIEGSLPACDQLTLFDLAKDVALIYPDATANSLVLIDHAFADRVVRASAARCPEQPAGAFFYRRRQTPRPHMSERRARQRLQYDPRSRSPTSHHQARLFCRAKAIPDYWSCG